MKIVIDTTVIVSAALKDRNPEAIIRFIVHNPACQWVVSTTIVAEYIAVLRRPKFGLPLAIVAEWEEMFTRFTIPVEVNVSLDFPRDQKDAKFLTCAIAANADYLITGDRDFTEAQKLLNATICSVIQFKALVIDATS